MTTLDEQMNRIADEIAKLGEVEIPIGDKTIKVNLSWAVFYSFGFTRAIIEEMLKRAIEKGELEQVNNECLAIIEVVITRGADAMLPLEQKKVMEQRDTDILPKPSGYIKNAKKDILPGYT